MRWWHRVTGFFELEAASGIVLFLAALVAVVWANAGSSYSAVFSGLVLTVIQDGLMTIFFFTVGMEIKRELVVGELRTLGSALLPAIAALGGMIVPAGIFALLNHGGPGAAGWAIPMATDIAFCVGCMTLLGDRVPRALVVFLTALAIFDDLGGVLVIALFYGSGLHWLWLLATALIAIAVFLCGRVGFTHWFLYLIAGAALWFTVHHSGVHATIAGVLLGFLIPARPKGGSPIDSMVRALHPWVAFGVMPLFALASSGVVLSSFPADFSVPLGAGLGLLVGKQLGIFLFTLAAAGLGIARLPGSVKQVYGVAVLGGIGFTVALFIAELAFAPAPGLLAGAKLGILAGSLLAGIAGSLVLRFTSRPAS
jgi:NhaA family Na+:H+ antiporter